VVSRVGVGSRAEMFREELEKNLQTKFPPDGAGRGCLHQASYQIHQNTNDSGEYIH